MVGKGRVSGAHGVPNRRRIAGEICELYHEAVRSEVASLTKGGRLPPPKKLDDMDDSDREWFIRAATACIELGADAREFVVAQFSRWREASAYHKRLLLPQPHHLGKVGARIRYLQHKVDEQTRRDRVVTIDEQPRGKRFFVEERSLRGLARVQRKDPADVLADQPESFSRDFLKHKGAWDAVKDVWEERNRT